MQEDLMVHKTIDLSTGLNESIRLILEQYSNFVLSQDPEELHQFRVEVKKARAFVKLHASTKNQLAWKEFKLIRPIFRQAGKIRDAQVFLMVLEKYGFGKKKVTAKLEKTIQKEQNRFLKKADTYELLLEKSLRCTAEAMTTIPESDVSTYFQKTKKQIGKLIAKKGVFPHLHEARKHIKNLLHLHQHVGLHAFGINVAYLQSVQEKIGEWHDLYQTRLWLKSNGYSLEKELKKPLKALVLEIKILSKGFVKKFSTPSSYPKDL